MVAGRTVLPQGNTGSLDPPRPCHGAVEPALAGSSAVSRLFALSPRDGKGLRKLEEVARTCVWRRHQRISQCEACIRHDGDGEGSVRVRYRLAECATRNSRESITTIESRDSGQPPRGFGNDEDLSFRA